VSLIPVETHAFVVRRPPPVVGCRGLWWRTGPRRILPLGPARRPPLGGASGGGWVAVFTPSCHPTVRRSLATLYAQSRPVMLSQRGITATAGTPLVRDSLAGGGHRPPPRQTHQVRPHEDASSGSSPWTKIPHCCPGRGYSKPRVAGRPLSPARDRRLEPTPNPTWKHPAPAKLYLASERPPRGAEPGRFPRFTHPYAAPQHNKARGPD